MMASAKQASTANLAATAHLRSVVAPGDECKGRLTNEPATRQATDPVTGESVDEATAVIARQVGNQWCIERGIVGRTVTYAMAPNSTESSYTPASASSGRWVRVPTAPRPGRSSPTAGSS